MHALPTVHACMLSKGQRVSARQGCIPHILAGPFRRGSVRQDRIPHVRTRAPVLTCMPCMLCGIACLACVVGFPVGASSLDVGVSSPTGVTHLCSRACFAHGACLHAFQGRLSLHRATVITYLWRRSVGVPPSGSWVAQAHYQGANSRMLLGRQSVLKGVGSHLHALHAMWDCMLCLRCGIACGCFFTWSSPCWGCRLPQALPTSAGLHALPTVHACMLSKGGCLFLRRQSVSKVGCLFLRAAVCS